MMLACSISFVLLNYLGVARKFYSNVSSYPDGLKVEDNKCYYNSVEMQNSNESQIDKTDDAVPKNFEANQPEPTNEPTVNETPATDTVLLKKSDYAYYLTIIAFINCASNGILPAVSSYSSLPYGSTAYHLSACLGNMANPLACLIAVFLPMHSSFGIGCFTLFATGTFYNFYNFLLLQ